MGVKIVFCTHSLQDPSSELPAALKVEGNSVKFTCPQPLQDEGFPVGSATYSFDLAFDCPRPVTLAQKLFPTTVTNFIQKRQNLVVFCAGPRSTPKRGIMFGAQAGDEGYAAKLIANAVQRGSSKGIFGLSCYVIGASVHLIDLLNLANEHGVLGVSVKGRYHAQKIKRLRVSSAADVLAAMKTVVKNYERVFAPVLCEKQPTPELEAAPPYMPESIVLQLHRYDNETSFAKYMEGNSMTFVALGDCERPVLCDTDPSVQQRYARAQRVLSSVAGIVFCCRSNKHRFHVGRTRLSRLLRRAYNAENGYLNNKVNGSTDTVFISHAFSDATWAEESFHSLSIARRIGDTRGSTELGFSIRDPTVDKWRLHNETPDPVEELTSGESEDEDDNDDEHLIYLRKKIAPNPEETELQHNNTTQSMGKEASKKQLSSARKYPNKNARRAMNGLEGKAKGNATRQAGVKGLLGEKEQTTKNTGENGDVQCKQMIKPINEFNTEVLEEGQANRKVTTEKEMAALNDIKTVGSISPSGISINGEEMEGSEGRLLEAPSAGRRASSTNRRGEMGARKRMEVGVEVNQNDPSDASRSKKFQMFNVVKDDRLNALVHQTINYLSYGTRMFEISSNRSYFHRFFFLSEDCKSIRSCDLDSKGNVLIPEKPAVTIRLKEINEIVIGLYTPSFVSFSGEEQLAEARRTAGSLLLTHNRDPTPNPNPFNLGMNNYRSFALLGKGKSVELVCEKDSDCEAWLLALKCMLYIRTPAERILEKRWAASRNIKIPARKNVEMRWGGPLDIQNMCEYESLMPEERRVCSANHIPPATFIRVKQEVSQMPKKRSSDLYDIRVFSGLDLFRSAQIYEYLCSARILPLL